MVRETQVANDLKCDDPTDLRPRLPYRYRYRTVTLVYLTVTVPASPLPERRCGSGDAAPNQLYSLHETLNPKL